MFKSVEENLLHILSIPSPTYSEDAMVSFLYQWVHECLSSYQIIESNKSVIIHPKDLYEDTRTHVCFVGHSDVIPKHVSPYEKDGKIIGSGASDMKGGLACFMDFLFYASTKPSKDYVFSLIVYAREENTTVTENGLYDLIQNVPKFFKMIDLSIIGEPTNNSIQLGCVGSIHVKFKVQGQACHSARPWDGDNALYKAIPFIQYMASLKPVKHTVFGVDFFDVISITESSCELGKTSIPGFWEGNINFRYAPVYTPDEAEQRLKDYLLNQPITFSILDNSPSGRVVESEVFSSVLNRLDCVFEAKQAWTDVAQITALGIPAFNFGPGLTSQAHRPDEYILKEDVLWFSEKLKKTFLV